MVATNIYSEDLDLDLEFARSAFISFDKLVEESISSGSIEQSQTGIPQFFESLDANEALINESTIPESYKIYFREASRDLRYLLMDLSSGLIRVNHEDFLVNVRIQTSRFLGLLDLSNFAGTLADEDASIPPEAFLRSLGIVENGRVFGAINPDDRTLSIVSAVVQAPFFTDFEKMLVAREAVLKAIDTGIDNIKVNDNLILSSIEESEEEFNLDQQMANLKNELETVLSLIARVNDIDDVDTTVCNNLFHTLSDIRSNTFGITVKSSLGKSTFDSQLSILRTRPGAIDVINDYSVFTKLYGISQHDMNKPISTCQEALSYLELGGWSPEETESYLRKVATELEKIIGFYSIISSCSRDEHCNTYVSSADFLGTLGITATNDVLTNSKSERIECNIVVDTDFPDMESFFSVRTIVLNALDNGATNIRIERTNEDPLTIEISDDITPTWDSNEKLTKYSESIETAYTLGESQPYLTSSEEQRGGAIAAYLAGQRFGRLTREQGTRLPERFAYLVDGDDKTMKKYVLVFPKGSRIIDLAAA